MKTRHAVASAIAAAAAFAVGTTAAAAPAIQEMVVTAQKRETALQDTPIAISAMGEEQIERDNIQDFRDVAQQVPSMTFTQLQGYTQISMRGIGTDLTNLAAETSVALYEDGVYRGAAFLQGTPSFDLERIEVLRGPQGTLYGRNATAGAANIISRRPSSNFEGNAGFTLGSEALRQVNVGISGPLIEGTLSGRASMIYEDRDGYRDNLTTGNEVDDNEIKGGRISLYWNPTEQLEFVLRGDLTKQEASNGLFVVLAAVPTPLGITPSNLGGFLTAPNPALGGASLAQAFNLTFPTATQPVIQDPDDLEVRHNVDAHRSIEQKGVSLTGIWTGEALTAKFIASHRDDSMQFLSDSDATDVLELSNDARQNNEQQTYELNLSGTLLGGDATWLLGAYYFKEDGQARFYYDLDALQTTFEAVFGLFGPGAAPLPRGSLTAFGTRLKTGQGRPQPFLDFRITQESESKALFGQSTWNATDALRLTLGLRYTTDKKDVHRELTNNLGGTPCDSQGDKEWDQFTGTAIADYRLSDDVLAYVSYSRGYKAGGFNAGECSGAFNPENLTAYEVGVKSQAFEDRLQLNASMFVYSYKDIQVNRFIQNASSITNAAEADIRGVELELLALPLEDLQLSGGLTFLDTEYGGNATFSDPIASGAPIEVDGNDLLRSPKWKLYAAVQYAWHLPIGTVTAKVDASYSDKYYFDVFEASLPLQGEMEQEAYTIANLRVGWESNDGNYHVDAFVENLTDELYSETRQAIGTTGAIIGEFSTPRRYGVRLSARLGE